MTEPFLAKALQWTGATGCVANTGGAVERLLAPVDANATAALPGGLSVLARELALACDRFSCRHAVKALNADAVSRTQKTART
jgi:hypothetical protein